MNFLDVLQSGAFARAKSWDKIWVDKTATALVAVPRDGVGVSVQDYDNSDGSTTNVLKLVAGDSTYTFVIEGEDLSGPGVVYDVYEYTAARTYNKITKGDKAFRAVCRVQA